MSKFGSKNLKNESKPLTETTSDVDSVICLPSTSNGNVNFCDGSDYVDDDTSGYTIMSTQEVCE